MIDDPDIRNRPREIVGDKAGPVPTAVINDQDFAGVVSAGRGQRRERLAYHACEVAVIDALCSSP
ncbi:MAG: hypothetical protein AUJ06_02685 [Chloroflexi bacterium 13_1_40CM_3_70_6]|nr:MAG: hypothetical protein AUJ06_02685 [Chloroflexi bacterium 13_1_40CM_3_70_6]